MCFNSSKSEQSTQATESVTTTDYGAIAEAEKILAQSVQLTSHAAGSPAQQMEMILIVGGILIAGFVVMQR